MMKPIGSFRIYSSYNCMQTYRWKVAIYQVDPTVQVQDTDNNAHDMLYTRAEDSAGKTHCKWWGQWIARHLCDLLGARDMST